MSTIERISGGELPLDFNWNIDPHPSTDIEASIKPEPSAIQAADTKIVAEDLRDGLHGIDKYPTADGMIDYIGKLRAIGIKNATVGIFPGEGTKIDESIKTVLHGMNSQFPDVTPIVLCMATEASLEWTARCKEINNNLNAIVFMGTAPSRLLVEEWSQEMILEKLSTTIRKATDEYGIDVIGATEHTTQTPPDFLQKIIQTQVESGAKTFCIADTIGTSRPIGTFRLVKFVRSTLDSIGANDVEIDWHGHRDLDLATINSLVAVSAGANRIHTVARGIGERAGNTQMEAILVNLHRIIEENGMESPWNLNMIHETLSAYSTLTGVEPPDHGTLGKRSHHTSLGIHTSAMQKAAALSKEAQDLGAPELANKLDTMSQTIYSAINPESVGKKHDVSVGPWSGQSTVRRAYEIATGKSSVDLNITDIKLALNTAKKLGRDLSTEELLKLINGHS